MSAKTPIDASFIRIGKIDDPEPPYAGASHAERLPPYEKLQERFQDQPVMREAPPPSSSRRWPTRRETLNSFVDHKVQFIVAGGNAVFFHGYVRTTDDIDLCVNPTARNAGALTAALQSLVFTHAELTAEYSTKVGSVFQSGRIPEQTGFLPQGKGVTWEDPWESSIQHDRTGARVRFLDLENLIRSKQAAGRLQGLADIERFQEIQRNSWLRDQ